MKPRPARPALAAALALALLAPAEALAGMALYALTLDGQLVRYDPETDDVRRGVATVRFEAVRRPASTLEMIEGERRQRVHLDASRRLIIAERSGQVAIVNFGTGTSMTVSLPHGAKSTDDGGTDDEATDDESTDDEPGATELLVPRLTSRFHVRQGDAMTPVSFSGRVLGKPVRSVVGEAGRPKYHPDGRRVFSYTKPGLAVALFDAETLKPLRTYDLKPLLTPGSQGVTLVDAAGDRALLVDWPAEQGHSLRTSWSAFTTDLGFAPSSASPRIEMGTSPHATRLTSDGRLIVVQEPIEPRSEVGGGRLHLFDARSGANTGTLEFPAYEGAEILAFHPDGRRLFLRTWDIDFTTFERAQVYLVMVDMLDLKVLRVRPFPPIGLTADFAADP